MAKCKHQSSTSGTRTGSLSMQIYAAMLGDQPSFEKDTPTIHPRLTMRLKVEATIQHAGSSQFHRTTLREHVERCAGYAARAIDEARERLAAARPKPIETLGDSANPSILKPIVLIGPAAVKASKPSSSRAA